MIDVMRAGLPSAAAALETQNEQRSHFGGLFALPKLAWTLAAAMLGLVALGAWQWTWRHSMGSDAAVVMLQATRGADANTTAPAGKPFTLVLDVTGLPALSQYRVEIVDGNGGLLLETMAESSNNQVRASVPHGFPAGAYYVRVSGAELLREYSLTLRE